MIEEEKSVQVLANPSFEDLQAHIREHLDAVLSFKDYHSKADHIVLTHLPKVTKNCYSLLR
jgi:hypothetical protein